MTTQEVKRKLTAILSADVKGYSRLMGEDEEGTIRTLILTRKSCQNSSNSTMVEWWMLQEIMFSLNLPAWWMRSDVLWRFKRNLKTRNAELPENRKMEFRIGVNLGDVIEDGEQILGDGVNIAARMESLADGGGICISGTVYDHIENKLSFGYEYLGEQTVKNIAKPVRVYRVLMEPGVTILRSRRRQRLNKDHGRRQL